MDLINLLTLHLLGLKTSRDAHRERVNLTIRRSIAGLARQTWATAQTAEHLLAQAA